MTNRTSTPRTAAELIDNDRVLKLADPRLVADIDAILNAFAEAARIDAEAEQARIDAEAQRRADLLADARRNDPEMSARVAARRAARRAERNF